MRRPKADTLTKALDKGIVKFKEKYKSLSPHKCSSTQVGIQS